jgi:hypothetical protein
MLTHRPGVTVGRWARLFSPAINRSAGDSFASRGQPWSNPRDKPDLSKSPLFERPRNAKRAGEAFPSASFHVSSNEFQNQEILMVNGYG